MKMMQAERDIMIHSQTGSGTIYASKKWLSAHRTSSHRPL